MSALNNIMDLGQLKKKYQRAVSKRSTLRQKAEALNKQINLLNEEIDDLDAQIEEAKA